MATEHLVEGAWVMHAGSRRALHIHSIAQGYVTFYNRHKDMPLHHAVELLLPMTEENMAEIVAAALERK